MVSSVTVVRLWSQQTALNAFKTSMDDQALSNSSSSNSLSSLADMLFSNGDDADEGFSGYEDIASLIASLQQAGKGAADDTNADASVDEISSKAFMKELREKLDGLKDSPETASMAESMLAALDAGTLTVTDVVDGEKVTAWNDTDSDQISAAKTAVDKTDWRSFLKDVLTRDSDGKFVRNEDSSYIEKDGGASSYFGMIGDRNYYISWTAPQATPETKA